MLHSRNIVDQPQESSQKNNKVVILWGSNNLLMAGFESYMKEIQEWEVIRVSSLDNFDYLLEVIEQHHPHTIILSEDSCDTARTNAQLLIQHCPDLKVITLSLDDNFAEILTKRKVFMTTMEEFLSLIN